MKTEEKHVLVIGSSNIDLNMYSKRFPTPGETLTGGTFSQSFGGKGANQAVAAVRSGSKTVFIGKVGNDSFGTQILDNLANEGINTSGIVVDPEAASGVAMILIDSNGQNMISVAPGANKNLVPDDLKGIKNLIENASVVVLQMEIGIDVIREIVDIAVNKGVISILNPAPFKDVPVEVLKKVDILTPNENEILKLHSSLGFKLYQGNFFENLPKIANDLHRCNMNTLVVTLGSQGCFVADKDTGEHYHVQGVEVEAIDAVGAGDCFNGVLASRLSKGDSLKLAAEYANIAASIAVTRMGAQTSMPFWTEIQQS